MHLTDHLDQYPLISLAPNEFSCLFQLQKYHLLRVKLARFMSALGYLTVIQSPLRTFLYLPDQEFASFLYLSLPYSILHLLAGSSPSNHAHTFK
jgi:hypothetical protein